MHVHLADMYLDTGSGLHLADPRVKVITTFVMILLIGLTPTGSFAAFVGFFAIMMIGSIVAKLDPWTVVKRSMVALPFAAAAVSLIFTVPGASVGTVPLLGWRLSEAGLIRFASIMLKSMISVQAGVLLMFTTHFTDLLWALGAMRVPRVLVAIISFMYRYIFVLGDEAVRLTRARDSRSAVLAGRPDIGRSIYFRARTTGRMIGNLFLRSYDRSERIYQAMVARGYQGEIRHLEAPPVKPVELLKAAIPLVSGLCILIISLL